MPPLLITASDNQGKSNVAAAQFSVMIATVVGGPLTLLSCCAAIDLVKKLLTVDPKKRISVDEALQHPWISVSILHFRSFVLW